jgi:hypothetical protein
MQNNMLKIIAVATLFAGCFTLSVWGYVMANLGLAEAVYRSIQLLVLEANFDGLTGPLSWQLEMARFLLPLFTVLAVISLLLSYFRRQWLLLRSQFFYPDAIFFGIGRTARAIVMSLPEKRRLLAIDVAAHSDIAQRLMAIHKLLVLEGDATDSRLLRRLPLFQSNDIYVFTGDDKLDLGIALTLCDYMASHTKPGQQLPKLIVDIDDAILLQTAQSEPSFARYRECGGEILWFSARRQAARAVLLEHPVLDKPSSAQQTVHVAIVGFDELQQDVVRQILRTSVYLRTNKLHFSVFCAETETYQRFVAKHASLFSAEQFDQQTAGILPLASIKLFTNDPAATQHQQVQQALEIAGHPFDVVYIHADSDYNALFHSQRILQALLSLNQQARVVCMLNGSHFSASHDAEAFIARAGDAYQGIRLFHCREALVQRGEGYPGEKMDSLGLSIHNAYNAIHRKLQPGENRWDNFESHLLAYYPQSKIEWQTKLSPQFMWSSRFAGDHLPVKIRELGFDLSDYNSASGQQKQELHSQIEMAITANLQQLMELEHRRFVAERLVDGWVYGAVTQKALKINNTLIPYNQLADVEKSKDEAMIRVLLILITEDST